MNFSFIILIIVFAIISSDVKYQELSNTSKKYDLKYQLETGKKFTFYSLGYGNNYNIVNNSKTFLSSRERELVQNYHVIDGNNKETVFEVEYKKLEFNDIDEDKLKTKTNFSPLVGKKVQFTILPKGEMTNFKGFEELPSIPFPNGVMDGKLCQAELTHMFPIFPEKLVGIGDTWSREVFGYIITYKVLSEIKFNGFDCVRISAQMVPEEKILNRKNEQGKEYTIERIGCQYSDMYYFAYKEGMILYRFSVDSYNETITRSKENEILKHNIRDQVWEEHVVFK